MPIQYTFTMSRYREIADDIRKCIESGSCSTGSRLPTENEYSKAYKASRQTIRDALAVLRSEGLIYQIQGSGTYVRHGIRKKGKAMTVEVISTYISDYIFPSIIRGIEESLSGKGIYIRLAATGNMVERERSILSGILDSDDIDALIVEGTRTSIPNPDIPLFEALQRKGIPIVFLHSSYPELEDAVVVGMDDIEGGRKAVRHLIAKGCRRIGGIFKSDDRQGLMRYRGFSEEIIGSGIGLENSYAGFYTTEKAADGITFSEKEIRKLSGYDGLVLYNDQTALSLIRDSRRYSLPVPEIASFDRSILNTGLTDIFYSLGHRKEELGRAAAEKIARMLDGRKEDSLILSWID